MCNRYDSERAAEIETLEGHVSEIEERRIGSALRQAAVEKVEIDVDTDVWEDEGGTAL